MGAGISGLVLAERYANLLNKRVVVIEKRNHIGGNCYDFFNNDGVLIPKYGPHFFHTNYEDVWQYVNKFSLWHEYNHRVLSFVDDMLVPVPVNITTINKLFSLNIQTEEGMIDWMKDNIEIIEDPKNSEEVALASVGRDLYEKMFKNYTKKQWDLWPSELDASVMRRIPVRMSFDDRYFSDKYQAMPTDGFFKLFENMVSNPLISIRLETNWLDIIEEIGSFDKFFFTGPVDDYFGQKYGKLQYRSLNFEFITLNQESYQPVAQVNYPNTETFTRITEPKHATGQKCANTTIIKEYPTWDGDEYYPVPNKGNFEIFSHYQREFNELEKKNVYFIGRLANYKYYNMDQSFKNALDLYYSLEN